MPHRLARSFALVLSGFTASCMTPYACPFPAERTEPGLTVVLVIDQLRSDRLDPSLPGGLGRLAREGRVFPRAALQHGLTETCPGHAAVATGRHPGPAGVPGNSYIEPTTGRSAYCVEDTTPAGVLLDPTGASGPGRSGRSPAAIRASALGDWLKQAQPASRVFAVAGKDRSAIALGGKHPDAAYWYSRAPGVGFTSSRYYLEALPEWVKTFGAKVAERVPERWEHDAGGYTAAPDDFEGESPRYGRTSGHPVREGDPKLLAERLQATPFWDDVTLAFARELVERENLGGKGTDLLLLGLSATDIVGHLYGPNSHEAADSLRRLDASLGQFLDFLEQRLGRGNVLIGLSADHGVLPLPEWLTRQGQQICPVGTGREPYLSLANAIGAELTRELKVDARNVRDWVSFDGVQLGVDREKVRAAGLEPEQLVSVMRRVLDVNPAVARTWTAAEIRAGTSDVARLYRNSLDPSRPPDLVIQVTEGCLIGVETTGTTHGTPYLYDRAVPVLLWGSGVLAGVDTRDAASVDLAPTLAARLGIAAPPDLDGKDLLGER